MVNTDCNTAAHIKNNTVLGLNEKIKLRAGSNKVQKYNMVHVVLFKVKLW